MTPHNSVYHIDKADGIVDLAGSLFKADGGSRLRAETHRTSRQTTGRPAAVRACVSQIDIEQLSRPIRVTGFLQRHVQTDKRCHGHSPLLETGPVLPIVERAAAIRPCKKNSAEALPFVWESP
jgi:hypothetical protein